MAKQMTFTDETGNTNSETFWILTYHQVEPEHKRLVATITGFRSQSDYEGGKSQIGAKGYQVIDPDVYDIYFAEDVLSAAGVTFASQIYQYASDTEDSDGASFFASAIDV